MKSFALLFCCTFFTLGAQQPSMPEKSFIEVTGTSEMEVVPDVIEVNITLREYVDGRDKMNIGRQEENLKKELKNLGIDLKQLTVVTAFADFQKVRLIKKDVVNSKTYLLKVNSAEMLSKVYEQLDKLSVHDARITRLDHTRILEYQKENRIKAIKAAKEKADYILTAIDQKAGDPLQVLEGENWVEHGMQEQRAGVFHNALKVSGLDAGADEDLSMRKIRIRSGFTVKFEIKK